MEALAQDWASGEWGDSQRVNDTTTIGHVSIETPSADMFDLPWRYKNGILMVSKWGRFSMEVDFEYDPEKSDANRAKHGIDFEQAQKLWWDRKRVAFVARFADETRSGLVAQLNGVLWTAIYTTREDRIRIISVRRARKNEENLYHDSEGI